ncbi:energy-coupling factor transporter transmembrane component T family protein [Acidipropionibacterium virtanenii]|uniref:Energy-coupling factor transporter transmembrane protein BioN n=1 Tax=Acidipropionibacterium virtanenii TaxID=2057246 RepID=A0A344UTG4_9ACTN|nr:energy-coupling factor transporter transmembrane protein EcfT [Acidipropionibacterium virtanenii]AXE38562.1 Energy-coupling factor transporter transmembrane protein BioN [Acidipropionibacterium virtanenii]
MTRRSGTQAGRTQAYLGFYRPGATMVHRMPVWAKYLLILALGVLPFVLRLWWFSLGCLAVAVLVCLLMARMPARTALRLGPALWVMNGLVFAYHAAFTDWRRGIVYAASLMACLYVARMLTSTTSPDTLMDAIAACARPFARIGARPEKFALAITLMWTTIPYMLSAFLSIRDAARARGLERSSWRFVLPTVVGMVGHALELGDALVARGLGDDPAVGTRKPVAL